MPRPSKNPMLQELLSERELTIGIVCHLLGRNRWVAGRWASGKERMPLFEKDLAKFLNMSVSTLRERVGLPPEKPNKKVKGA